MRVTVVVLLYAVLVSRFGWGLLVFALIVGGFAFVVGRRIARRMARRYPDL
jgi:hypothetical protein